MGLADLSKHAQRTAWRGLSAVVCGFGRADDKALHKAVRGKNIVVSGASYGIGEATARRLGRAGANVIILARSAERLEQVAGEIRGNGGNAHAYAVDLTDSDAVDAFVATVLHEHGPVDVLVNNAGKSIRRSIELSEGRYSDFERTMRINYLAPVKLTLALLPSMRARGAGHVVNVATWAVRFPPSPRWSAYHASKGAFDYWMRGAGQELRSAGISTTSVYMGLVRTRMSAPTYANLGIPSLHPIDAAGMICDGIVYRHSKVEAPWIAPVAVLAQALRGPIELAGAFAYPHGDDTASAKAAVTAANAAADV
jgi:NAD(P)-dependent dehydrogenase (short-subunit alcohol dehydrogenase family)